MKNCQFCQASMDDADVFCRSCGKKQEAPVAAQVPPPARPAATPPPAYSATPPPAYPATPPAGPAPKKKGRGCLIAFLIVLAVLVLIAAAIFFLIPGLFRPADYGVAISEEAYLSAHDKLDYEKDESPQEGEASDYITTYSGRHPIDASLTSEEITSMLGYNRSVYTRFSHPQVRINEDGSIDAAVRVNVGYVFQELLFGRYDEDDLRSVFPAVGILPATVNVHGNVSGRVIDNELQIDGLDSAAIQGIPVPQVLLGASETHRFIENHITEYIRQANERTGSSYERIEVEDGLLQMQGYFPSSISRDPAD